VERARRPAKETKVSHEGRKIRRVVRDELTLGVEDSKVSKCTRTQEKGEHASPLGCKLERKLQFAIYNVEPLAGFPRRRGCSP
jgi:hypothetical protein